MLETALLVAFGVYMVERLLPSATRVISLFEKRYSALPGKPIDLPADIKAMCDAENEPWAREQMTKLVREKFFELGSWDLVRREVFKVPVEAE